MILQAALSEKLQWLVSPDHKPGYFWGGSYYTYHQGGIRGGGVVKGTGELGKPKDSVWED